MNIPATRRRLAVFATVLALGLLAACGDSSTPDTETDPGSESDPTSESVEETTEAAPELTGTITVFAAASLTDVFGALGEQFEQDNPGVTVQFNFASSSTLAQQITQGAPADVFASASPATMQTVVDAGGNDGEPEVFVQNTLEIVVPAGNPAGVTGLEDFADEDLIIALCAEQVPCGAASITVFEAAGITPEPDSLESDVRAVLTKVELGEVDAALVYRTDVLAGGDAVEGIEFPESGEAVNDYPIVSLVEGENPDAGAAFIEFIRSEAGLAALEEAGFQIPSPCPRLR
ncbi:molybdate ABC transporter substrate-binding protein [soil metagenome]